MKCPDTGTWQAFLDGEVGENEKNLLEKHAAHCTRCAAELKELSALEDWCGERLAAYNSSLEQLTGEARLGRETVNNNSKLARLKGVLAMKRGYKKWAAVAASVLLISGALTLAPVQEAVANFLSIFRVQKIEVVQLSPSDLDKMARDIESRVGEVDLQQFGKVNNIKNPESKKMTLDEAREILPFTVKEPAFIPSGFSPEEQVLVIDEGKSEFRLNVEQANSLLKSLGSETLLPESLEGKAFSIKTPAILQAKYVLGDGGREFSWSQFESPEITAPAGVDVQALRAALLDLPVLPADLRTQLAGIEDWQHTLVLPSARDTEELTIAGQEAIFARGKGDFSSLIWVDGGVIYQVSGQLDRDTAIKVANSMYESN